MKLHRNLSLALAGMVAAVPAMAAPFVFDNGNVSGQIASASRPGAAGIFEIEAADDFQLTARTRIDSASFTGLLPLNSSPGSVTDVTVEIYRVFPFDSDTNRTSGPPLFSTSQVPTRVNSPSDVAFGSRASSGGTLAFATAVLNANFTAANSLHPGGIHPMPNQTTGGTGPVAGMETRFDITFSTPFDLEAGHYFFVPQVGLAAGAGDFLWLSSVRPIVAPGTPFLPDLQAWARDESLDPDWLRIGTDIVGGAPATTFNLAFSLNGETVNAVPEPATWALLAAGLAGLGGLRRRSK